MQARPIGNFAFHHITNQPSTSISWRWRTHATRCIMANVVQTKVDAQCDKHATELSWQHLQRSTFRSCSKLITDFNLPHLHLAPTLGVTPVEFCGDLQHQKTRVPGLSCGTVCVILHLAISVEHQLVTDNRNTTTAYTALARHCVVKTRGFAPRPV